MTLTQPEELLKQALFRSATKLSKLCKRSNRTKTETIVDEVEDGCVDEAAAEAEDVDVVFVAGGDAEIIAMTPAAPT